MKINNLPLYKAELHKNIFFHENSNAGLIFEKFFDGYDSSYCFIKKDKFTTNNMDYKKRFLEGFLSKINDDYYLKFMNGLISDYVTELKKKLESWKNANENNYNNLQQFINEVIQKKSFSSVFYKELKNLKMLLEGNHKKDELPMTEFFQNLGDMDDDDLTALYQYVKNVSFKPATLVSHGSTPLSINLTNFKEKQVQLVASFGGTSQKYKLDWHMVTGMGNPHPIENGFLWHHTLGVPYIPGSQVKGLVRSLIEQYFEGNDVEKKDLLLRWFGSESKRDGKADNNQVGQFIFFDAIPTKPPVLTIDIMTPHMGDWYQKGNAIEKMDDADNIPADWHDPTPIPFLAVKEATFLFSIAHSKANDNDDEIAEVFDVLDKALEYLGVGAKTQTGYGYMSMAKKHE